MNNGHYFEADKNIIYESRFYLVVKNKNSTYLLIKPHIFTFIVLCFISFKVLTLLILVRRLVLTVRLATAEFSAVSFISKATE